MLTFRQTPELARRVATLSIAADMFLEMLRRMDGKRRLLCKGLPADARVVGIRTDRFFNTVELFLESSEFEEMHTEALSVVPELHLDFSEFYGNAMPAEPWDALTGR